MVVVLAPPAVAQAAVRYAEPGGNGPAASCPEADPCEIQAAVENGMGTPGDEVILRPGTYDLGGGTLDVDFDTVLHGAAGSPPPRIVSSGAVVYVLEASVVRDVTIESTSPGSLALTAFGSATVERVTAIATDGGSRACILTSWEILRDSVCWSQEAVALEADLTSGPIRNVTAVGGTFGILANAEAPETVAIDAVNVIARGETADVRTQGAGTATVSLGSSNYATESQGAGAITDPGTAFNQTSPPLFANALVGDFHQLPGSPTVNSGNVIAGQLGTADVDGEGRIQGASIDIGADELDEIAPETTITKAPKNRVKTKKRRKRATIMFEADDPAASFACSLDRKPFAPCTSPFTKRVKKGRHRFEVAATDAAGNADQTPDDARWKLKRKRER